MLSRIFAAALLGLLPGFAQATVYECKVNPGAPNVGWLSEQYFFEYVPERGSIEIFDPLIAFFNKDKPMKGTVTSENEAKVTFKWAVFVKDNKGQRTKMDFRGVLYFASSEFSVQGNPVGYDNKFDARGRCSVAQ